jgi:hypothetical protein
LIAGAKVLNFVEIAKLFRKKLYLCGLKTILEKNKYLYEKRINGMAFASDGGRPSVCCRCSKSGEYGDYPS